MKNRVFLGCLLLWLGLFCVLSSESKAQSSIRLKGLECAQDAPESKVQKAVGLCQSLGTCYWKGQRLLKLSGSTLNILKFGEFFLRNGYVALLDVTTFTSPGYSEAHASSLCMLQNQLEQCETDPKKICAVSWHDSLKLIAEVT